MDFRLLIAIFFLDYGASSILGSFLPKLFPWALWGVSQTPSLGAIVVCFLLSFLADTLLFFPLGTHGLFWGALSFFAWTQSDVFKKMDPIWQTFLGCLFVGAFFLLHSVITNQNLGEIHAWEALPLTLLVGGWVTFYQLARRNRVLS